MAQTTHESFWSKHTDKVGIGGSLFAALCCLGAPALVSILTAIGAGFLINDAILLPLLGVSLLLALGGLYLGVRHHGSWVAFVVGVVSAVGMFIFIAVAANKVLAYISIAGLITASFLNIWLRVRRSS